MKEIEVFLVKEELRSDENYARIQCPGCMGIGTIDKDQFEGRVSILCECGWHETHDLRDGG